MIGGSCKHADPRVAVLRAARTRASRTPQSPVDTVSMSFCMHSTTLICFEKARIPSGSHQWTLIRKSLAAQKNTSIFFLVNFGAQAPRTRVCSTRFTDYLCSYDYLLHCVFLGNHLCVSSQPPPQTALCPHFTESPPTWSRLPRPTYQEHP